MLDGVKGADFRRQSGVYFGRAMIFPLGVGLVVVKKLLGRVNDLAMAVRDALAHEFTPSLADAAASVVDNVPDDEAERVVGKVRAARASLVLGLDGLSDIGNPCGIITAELLVERFGGGRQAAGIWKNPPHVGD